MIQSGHAQYLVHMSRYVELTHLDLILALYNHNYPILAHLDMVASWEFGVHGDCILPLVTEDH